LDCTRIIRNGIFAHLFDKCQFHPTLCLEVQPI
jgi:hypothetical protein